MLIAAPRSHRASWRARDPVVRQLDSDVRQSFGERDWARVHDLALEWIEHDDRDLDAWLHLARSSELLAMPDQAARAWNRLEGLTRFVEHVRHPRNSDLDRRAWALQGVGRADEARALWSAAADSYAGEREGPWRNRSRYLVLSGRTDEALALFEDMAARGWSHAATLRDNVDFDSIRDHPRFQRVYERVLENARVRREAVVEADAAAEPHAPPLGTPIAAPDPLSSP